MEAGRIAYSVRCWLGDPSAKPLALADVWWLAMAYTAGHSPQPRLLQLEAGRGVVQLGDVTTVVGPGPWDGRLMAAIGTGTHFDPLFWGDRTQPCSWVPAEAAGTLGQAAGSALEMGPAAALLIGLRAQSFCPVPLHPAQWPDALPATALALLEELTLAHLSRAGLTPAPDWATGCLVVRCTYGQGFFAHANGPSTADAPLAQLVLEARPMRAEATAPWGWILALDMERMWLGQLPSGGEATNFLLAAAGRLTA